MNKSVYSPLKSVYSPPNIINQISDGFEVNTQFCHLGVYTLYIHLGLKAVYLWVKCLFGSKIFILIIN